MSLRWVIFNVICLLYGYIECLGILLLTNSNAHNYVRNFSLVQVFSERLCSGLEDLFFFFATTRSKHVFTEHLHYRVREAKVCPVLFLTRLISREGLHGSLYFL